MMKKIFTILAVSAAMMIGVANASGKKASAVTQMQASGSVATQSIANSIANASNVGITVTGRTSAGIQVLITATQSGTGKSVSVPATASIVGGKVLVVFADGSSTTFEI